MKKILPLLVIGIFFLSGFGAGAFSYGEMNKNINGTFVKNLLSFNDDLDQSQINTSLVSEGNVMPIGRITLPENHINFQIAQSFIPSREVLTRVELYIGKNSTATYPLMLAIRDALSGDDLRITSVDPSNVPTESYDWVEIDFDDIGVNIGTTYYLVCYTENVTDNFYAWGAHNDSESYPYGCAWMSVDDGDTWTNESTILQEHSKQTRTTQSEHDSSYNDATWDMCFKTYGRDNLPPNAPKIDGPTSGKAGEEYDYNFSTIDSEGDDVYLWILWFDGCPSVDWIGPYASGEIVTLSYIYEKRGKYVISAKAKDIHEAESNWSTLEVTMPKSNTLNKNLNFLELLIERFLLNFPIIRQLL